jgi:hypothetical protein
MTAGVDDDQAVGCDVDDGVAVGALLRKDRAGQQVGIARDLARRGWLLPVLSERTKGEALCMRVEGQQQGKHQQDQSHSASE